jgi:hypothetical protein
MTWGVSQTQARSLNTLPGGGAVASATFRSNGNLGPISLTLPTSTAVVGRTSGSLGTDVGYVRNQHHFVVARIDGRDSSDDHTSC